MTALLGCKNRVTFGIRRLDWWHCPPLEHWEGMWLESWCYWKTAFVFLAFIIMQSVWAVHGYTI